jgi:hypothetical protein
MWDREIDKNLDLKNFEQTNELLTEGNFSKSLINLLTLLQKIKTFKLKDLHNKNCPR